MPRASEVLGSHAPAGRRTPLRIGEVLPATTERRPLVDEAEVRDEVRAVARADDVHPVMREHLGEDGDVDVPAPRRVGVAAFLRDVCTRVRRLDVEPVVPIHHGDEHRGHLRCLDPILQVLGVEVVLAGLPVELHPRHQVVPVEGRGGAGLGRDEEEEAGGETRRELIEHLGSRESLVCQHRPLELEELLGRRQRDRRLQATVLLVRHGDLLGRGHGAYSFRVMSWLRVSWGRADSATKSNGQTVYLIGRVVKLDVMAMVSFMLAVDADFW